METLRGTNKEHPPELTYRRATENDLAVFMDIEHSVIDARTYPASTDRDEALEEIRRSTTYFILENGTIVGDIAYRMSAPDRASIDGLAVHPDYQGRGIGRAAMEKVLEELKGVPVIDVVTHPENTRAIELYESLGFTRGEVVENYYGDDGEPRVVMTLKR